MNDIKEDISSKLKAGAIVEVEYDSPYTMSKVRQKLKIISELRKIVILENGWSLAKPDGRPYSFCGELISIK